MKTLCGLSLVCVLGACASELDTSRESVDTGSFGTTLMTLACKRVAYVEDLAAGGAVDVRGDEYRESCRQGIVPETGPGALKALLAERASLIGAVDTAMPEGFLPELQGYLTANEFLRIYDDGTADAAVDALVGALELAAADPELAPALARMGRRDGYAPREAGSGMLGALAGYVGLHELLLAVPRVIVTGGSAQAEWADLVEAVGISLRNAEAAADPGDPERTGALAVELLLREHAELGSGRAMGLVRRDHRGMARVAAQPDGQLPPPFADTDGDGLADIDESGRFIGVDGAALVAPSPYALPPGDEREPWPYRDEQGRALTGDGGDLVYEHIDLDHTVLAAVARDAAALLSPQAGTALDALRGASALMGPRQMVSRAYANGESIDYRGYDTSAAPLLDMVFGYLQLMRYPAMDDVLALSRELMTGNQAELSRLIEAFIRAARLGDAYPELAIAANSPLWDDLIPVLGQIVSVPGLAEELMDALDEVGELGPRFADYMTYSDRFDIDPATQAVTGSLATPVDRQRSDSNFNRSLMQRLLHLVADSNHAVLCNKDGARIDLPVVGIPIATYDECALVRIDNLATFYVRSIVREAVFPFDFDNNRLGLPIAWAVTDDMLEDMMGITDFRTRPTPEALNRTLFLSPAPEALADVMDPPVCRDGHQYLSGHGGTLPVWEKNGFYEQVKPIVQAFVDHDAEQLFVDLLTVLHNHWPSPSSNNHQQNLPGDPNYAYASSVVGYEPLIVDILRDGQLLSALVETAPVLDAVQVSGRGYRTIMAGMARYLLTPNPALRTRDGRSETTTADGRPVTVLSPWQLLADAYALRRERLGAVGSEGDAWRDSIAEVIDVFARGEDVAGQGWRFKNPRLAGVSVALVDFLRARLAVHRSARDLDAWLGSELPARIEELMSGPVFAGGADFVLSLQASPEARIALESLMRYLTSESNREAFVTAQSSLADLAQLATIDDRDILPVARVMGEVLRPERGWLDSNIRFFLAARGADQGQVLTTLLQQLYSSSSEHTAIHDLVNGIAEVHREQPYEHLGQPLEDGDYRQLLAGVASFLDDEKRGLRKFIAIIKGRNL